MASASAETAILFIASLIVAAGVGGVVIEHGSTIASSITDHGQDRADELRGDIEIITDPAGPVYNTNGNGNITVHVMNAGARTLPNQTDSIDVFYDGDYISDIKLTDFGGPGWPTDEVIAIEFSVSSPSSGPHRVKVVTGGGSDIFTFRV